VEKSYGKLDRFDSGARNTFYARAYRVDGSRMLPTDEDFAGCVVLLAKDRLRRVSPEKCGPTIVYDPNGDRLTLMDQAKQAKAFADVTRIAALSQPKATRKTEETLQRAASGGDSLNVTTASRAASCKGGDGTTFEEPSNEYVACYKGLEYRSKFGGFTDDRACEMQVDAAEMRAPAGQVLDATEKRRIWSECMAGRGYKPS
jgi:hypothetical protein